MNTCLDYNVSHAERYGAVMRVLQFVLLFTINRMMLLHIFEGVPFEKMTSKMMFGETKKETDKFFNAVGRALKYT